MDRPYIQIGNETREMTEEEYAKLLAAGWTEEELPVEPAVSDVAEPSVTDETQQ